MAGKVAAGFVIFRKINSTIQYLLLQTSYGEHHWTPPKGLFDLILEIQNNYFNKIVGHVDPGETDEMVTALRETEEEAGLKKKDLNIFNNSKKSLVYNVQGKPKTVIYWLAELIDPNTPVILSEEHQALKWLPLQEACDVGKYDDMKQLLQFYDNYLKNLN